MMDILLEQRIDFDKITGIDILSAMIDGLENPVSDEVGMAWFVANRDGGTCIACAATNALCVLHGSREVGKGLLKLSAENCGVGITSLSTLWKRVDLEYEVLIKKLELGIDVLRKGEPGLYNAAITSYEALAHLTLPEKSGLPHLSTETYQDKLPTYKAWLEELEANV